MSIESIKISHYEKVKSILIRNKHNLYSLRMKNIYIFKDYFIDNIFINIITIESISLNDISKLKSYLREIFPSFDINKNICIIFNTEEILSFRLGTLII